VTTSGWDDTKMRAARFQQIGSSNVPSLWGYCAAIDFSNRIGMDCIEKRHRSMMDYLHGELIKRGAQDWTSTNPAMRCALSAVNTPPIEIAKLEPALWQKYKIRIRGGAPYKIRLSTPYYLLRKDVDRFLAKYDEYRSQNKS
jgi:selenocysteine lyase/cysteine desulfurase